jgi:hypothetical protein
VQISAPAAPVQPESVHPRPALLAAFLACFTAAAVFYQCKSSVPPSVDGAPIELFTGGLLWMLSLVALQLADQRLEVSRGRGLFWLAAAAALGLLSLDETFGYHERTRGGAGDDDHIKLAAWLGVAAVLWLICRLEQPRRLVVAALLAGFAFHCLYGVVEFGDGDYFRVPALSLGTLQLLEEYFELLTLEGYLAAFLFLLYGGKAGSQTLREPGEPSTLS